MRVARAQAWQHRTDGKLYRLHTPQTPIARTSNYDKYAMDEFPSGTNAIVAVLAYTGARCPKRITLLRSMMLAGASLLCSPSPVRWGSRVPRRRCGGRLRGCACAAAAGPSS